VSTRNPEITQEVECGLLWQITPRQNKISVDDDKSSTGAVAEGSSQMCTLAVRLKAAGERENVEVSVRRPRNARSLSLVPVRDGFF